MKRIRYTQYKDDGELTLPEYNYKDIPDKFVRQYEEVIGLLFGFPKSTILLMNYISMVMGDNNTIQITKTFRDNFNIFLSNEGLLEYKEKTFYVSLKNLTRADLLIHIQRGVYMVNPIYYDRGKESDRVKKIQVLLEFRAGARPRMFRVTEK